MKAIVVGDNFNVPSGLTYIAKNLRRNLEAMGFDTLYLSISGPKHERTQKEFFYREL